jgi:hypothetical protein
MINMHGNSINHFYVSSIFFDYQVVIINMTKISHEHNDVALIRLYTVNKPHQSEGVTEIRINRHLAREIT